MTQTRSADRSMVLGVIALVLLLGAFILVGSGKFAQLRSGADREVTVIFNDAQQTRAAGFMRSGSEVRIHGVPVGEVKRLSHDAGAGTAKITVGLTDDAGPLYADARASLRWQTLLGANYYIALERGTRDAGPLGSTPIPPERTSNQVELEDITSILQNGARAGLMTMPGELSVGLSDDAALNRGLKTLNQISPDATRGLRAARGEFPGRDLQDLIDAAGRTVTALDTPTDRLRDVVEGAASLVTTTADHQDDLRSIISRGPGTLQTTDVTLARLDTTLDGLDPLIAELQDAAPLVAPTLNELRPTVLRANRLAHDAVPLLRSLRVTAGSLADTAPPALQLLRELTSPLDRLNDDLLPYLDEKWPDTQRTTGQMIGPGIAAYASAAGLVDEVGRAIRFQLSLGSSDLVAPCQVYLANPDKQELLACQSLGEALETVVNYDPLGATPGSAPAPESKGAGK